MQQASSERVLDSNGLAQSTTERIMPSEDAGPPLTLPGPTTRSRARQGRPGRRRANLSDHLRGGNEYTRSRFRTREGNNRAADKEKRNIRSKRQLIRRRDVGHKENNTSPPRNPEAFPGSRAPVTNARRLRGTASPKSKLEESLPRQDLTNDNTKCQGTAREDPDFNLRRLEVEEFRRTGDYNVFANFMSPFLKSDRDRDLSAWEYDDEKERWWRTDRSTGLVIWAPTPDSFLLT